MPYSGLVKTFQNENMQQIGTERELFVGLLSLLHGSHDVAICDSNL